MNRQEILRRWHRGAAELLMRCRYKSMLARRMSIEAAERGDADRAKDYTEAWDALDNLTEEITNADHA